MTFSRIIKFLKQYLFKHPLYVVIYGVAYFLKDLKFNIHFYSADEVINILREGKSLIRFGDGEINLLLDLKNHYHSFSPKLKMMIREIITEYSPQTPYILSVPRFINFSNTELKSIGKFNVWLPFKVMFLLIFPKKVSYMDAHNFYYDQYFERVIAPIFKDRTIVCITKKETIEKQKNNLAFPWKDMRYIETPENDVLEVYIEIKKSLDKELNSLKKEDVVLFIAMGPVGKYLIFDYAKRGYQCVDVGRGMETAFTDESLERWI